MKVYVVTADTWNGGWGTEIHLFAVCTTEEKAREIMVDNSINGNVDEVELDKFKDIYLGGYIE